MGGATMKELQELHRNIVKSLNKRIEEDLEDNIPTDAATYGAAIKLLKDNNVTADPADADDLADMREKLIAKSKQRRKIPDNVIPLDADSEMYMEANSK